MRFLPSRDDLAEHEPWGWQDPRTSLILPFWLACVPDLKIVVCLRNPLEVAVSLHQQHSTSAFILRCRGCDSTKFLAGVHVNWNILRRLPKWQRWEWFIEGSRN